MRGQEKAGLAPLAIAENRAEVICPVQFVTELNFLQMA